MFKGYWGNGFASGLIVTVLLTVLFTVFVSHGYDSTGSMPYAVDQASYNANQCGDGNKPVWGPWFGLCFGLFDSLAQWLMMAFAIVATGLLLATLKATQDLARDAKDIGDKQVATSNSAIKVAQDANKVAAQHFRVGVKPWISVEMQGPFLRQSGFGSINIATDTSSQPCPVAFNATITIRCIGDIAATIEGFDARLHSAGDWENLKPQVPPISADHTEFFAILQKGDAIKVDPRTGITDYEGCIDVLVLDQEYRGLVMKHCPPVIGKVIYSDPLGNRYEHNFAFVASPAWGDTFKRYGGKVYNYEREADA